MRIPTLLLVYLYFFCMNARSQPTKIYLNPKAAGGANQSMFIDSLKFYPLENYKEVALGRYSSTYITDRYFLLNNYVESFLFVYTKDGKFVKKVSYANIAKWSAPSYDKLKQQLIFFLPNKNYALTEKDVIQIQKDFINKRNKKYYKKYIIDLNDSSFAVKKAAPTAFDILEAYNLKDDLYCTYKINVNPAYKDTLDYEVKLYKDTKFINGYFPYNKQSETRYLYARYAAAITMESGRPDTFYISRPYVDTVYALANGIITPRYQFILPMENSIPKSFFEKPFKNKTERENFERNNGWLLRQVYNVIESDRFIVTTIGFLSNYGRYFYDKKTTAAYNIEKIKPDSVQYNLPLINENFGNRQGNKYYAILSPEQLKKVYEQKDKSAPFPKELEACFADAKNPSPLIVEYIIKAD